LKILLVLKELIYKTLKVHDTQRFFDKKKVYVGSLKKTGL